MTVQDGKFHLVDAWRLTRGHAGALLVIGLCIMVMAIVIEAVIGAAISWRSAAELCWDSRTPCAASSALPQAFFAPPIAGHSSSNIWPILVVAGLVTIPLNGGVLAIIGAPWARAYRDLAQPDVAATFS